MKGIDRRTKIILMLIGAIAAVLLGIQIAPHTYDGLPGFLKGIGSLTWKGFLPPWPICDHTGRTVFGFLAVYGFVCLYILVDERQYRYGEEYGSARWGDPISLNRSISNRKQKDENIILTQHVKLGTGKMTKVHKMPINVVVVGGPGTGKSRYVVMPTLMQMLSSYIVLDPSGELLANIGGMMQEAGYTVRVLNLTEPQKSDHFNPFHYITSSLEVVQLSEIFWKATTEKDAGKGGDPFWDNTAKGLFTALAEYLFEAAPKEKQNFPMLCELIDFIDIDEEHPNTPCRADVLFADLEAADPSSFAVKLWKEFRSGAGKTIKSIKITLQSHLSRAKIPEIQGLLCNDTMNLLDLSQKKTVVFCVTPVADTSLNFIVSMMYQVLFNILYAQGEKRAQEEGTAALPVPVTFLMDEFANVSIPNDFVNRLGTMRKYGIYCVIILQAVNQLKSLFKDEWESIMGMAAAILYLGGQEQSTHEYLSKYMGKSTIGTKNSSRSFGKMPGSNVQRGQLGRELMTPDEIRQLSSELALLLVQGKPPIRDAKYNLEGHSRYALTAMADPSRTFSYDARTSEMCVKMVRMKDSSAISNAVIIDIIAANTLEEEAKKPPAAPQDEEMTLEEELLYLSPVNDPEPEFIQAPLTTLQQKWNELPEEKRNTAATEDDGAENAGDAEDADTANTVSGGGTDLTSRQVDGKLPETEKVWRVQSNPEQDGTFLVVNSLTGEVAMASDGTPKIYKRLNGASSAATARNQKPEKRTSTAVVRFSAHRFPQEMIDPGSSDIHYQWGVLDKSLVSKADGSKITAFVRDKSRGLLKFRKEGDAEFAAEKLNENERDTLSPYRLIELFSGPKTESAEWRGLHRGYNQYVPKTDDGSIEPASFEVAEDMENRIIEYANKHKDI